MKSTIVQILNYIDDVLLSLPDIVQLRKIASLPEGEGIGHKSKQVPRLCLVDNILGFSG